MQNLFCRVNNQNHCLAIREHLKEGLCVKLSGKAVNVVSDASANGVAIIKIDGVNQKFAYRVPGLFYYQDNEKLIDGKWVIEKHIVYIENGNVNYVNLDQFPYDLKPVYFDRYSGYYFLFFSVFNTNKCYIVYSVDGIAFNVRDIYTDLKPYVPSNIRDNWSWWNTEISEFGPDEQGGFNVVLKMRGDRTDLQQTGDTACFAQSFHLNDLNEELVATEDFTYIDFDYGDYHYPEVPKHYNFEYEINTINGFTESKETIDGVTHIYFTKIESGITQRYELSTNNIIWDPISKKYYMLKAGADYRQGSHNYFDLNIYSSETLVESDFVIVQKLATYDVTFKSQILPFLHNTRQREYS